MKRRFARARDRMAQGLRDCGFTDIANGACGGVNLGGLFNAIKAMSWFAGSYTPKNPILPPAAP